VAVFTVDETLQKNYYYIDCADFSGTTHSLIVSDSNAATQKHTFIH